MGLAGQEVRMTLLRLQLCCDGEVSRLSVDGYEALQYAHAHIRQQGAQSRENLCGKAEKPCLSV